jgi:MFS family permease
MAQDVVLGLRANWRQFWLLVTINAFVGAMVGLERTVLPLLAETEFGIGSRSAALSFIATFGLVKAVTNWFAGTLGDRIGRKRVLVFGWLMAIPVPFLIIAAPNWGWIIVANVFLGLNQGLAWSTTVIMKIDLVGPRRRGLAMGLNEFAGYLAVGVTAFATGVIAQRFGLRPEPIYLGVAFSALGLGLSVLFVKDTMAHVRHEAGDLPTASGPGKRELFAEVSWKDPAMASCSQAGLVNNLNDGMAWGVFPLFFAAAGLGVAQIGVLAAVYPATWGVVQLGTGALSDRWGRRWLIVGGMVLQGGALLGMGATSGFGSWVFWSILLGIGTAMVYPTLIAAIGDVSQPAWRGSAVGVYRFWRDMGYVVGALGAGVIADLAGMDVAIQVVGALTIGSGLLVAARMPETRPPTT